jgi:hypothetical protein
MPNKRCEGAGIINHFLVDSLFKCDSVKEEIGGKIKDDLSQD